MEKKIKQIIANDLCLSDEDILDEMHLISELDYDENSFLELIMELEEVFSVELDEIMLIEIDKRSDCFYFEDEEIIEDDDIILITVKDVIFYLKMKMNI